MESNDKNCTSVSGINNQITYSETKKLNKKKSKKRKHTSSCSGSEDDKSKKLKSKHKKCKKRHKQSKDKKHKQSKSKTKSSKMDSDEDELLIGPEIPIKLLQKAQSMAPMSKEEWDKRQNTLRRVIDEETGRSRLIRGDGEIVEEIVSRDQHKQINRQATQGDGEFFQSKLENYV